MVADNEQDARAAQVVIPASDDVPVPAVDRPDHRVRVITFAPEPLYEWYVDAPRVWNLTPLADQQIGAIIMKIGGGIIFGVLIVIAFFKWFDMEEGKARADAADQETRDRQALD